MPGSLRPMDRHRYVADAVVTCDATDAVYTPGAVEVADGRIAWVGPVDGEAVIDDSTTVHHLGGGRRPAPRPVVEGSHVAPGRADDSRRRVVGDDPRLGRDAQGRGDDQL